MLCKIYANFGIFFKLLKVNALKQKQQTCFLKNRTFLGFLRKIIRNRKVANRSIRSGGQKPEIPFQAYPSNL